MPLSPPRDGESAPGEVDIDFSLSVCALCGGVRSNGLNNKSLDTCLRFILNCALCLHFALRTNKSGKLHRSAAIFHSSATNVAFCLTLAASKLLIGLVCQRLSFALQIT
jgi:hypothetical protein